MEDNELSFYFAECTVCGDMADYNILGNFYCETCYNKLTYNKPIVNNQFENFIIARAFIKFKIDEPLKVEVIIRHVKEKDHLSALELFDDYTKHIYPDYIKSKTTILRTHKLIEI